jgi:cbb3-type cytochrome oxidase maturation protein
MDAAMSVLIYLIPAALFLGLLGLGAFLWALKSGQFDDLDGAAERILIEDEAPEENGIAPRSPRRRRTL